MLLSLACPNANRSLGILEEAPYISDTAVACRPVIVDIHNDQMQSYKLISRPRGAGAHHQDRERWEHGGGRRGMQSAHEGCIRGGCQHSRLFPQGHLQVRVLQVPQAILEALQDSSCSDRTFLVKRAWLPSRVFDGHRITKYSHHVSPIVQDRQAVSSLSSKLESLAEEVCDYFDGICCFHVSPWDIPHCGQKPTSLSGVSREKHPIV